MAFSGWPEEALEFYEGLEADNSKAYWTAHKPVYDTAVLRPMTELTEELAPEFGAVKIFRPYRDMRFSRDKVPYKTNIAATIGSGYVSLSAGGLAAGDGMYVMSADQLGRYRQAVDSDVTGGELEAIVAVLAAADAMVTAHSELKKAPRGYPADHPRIGLLRRKGLVAWKEWPVAPWLGTPAAREQVAAFLRSTRPLTGWLHTHVGPPAEQLS